MTLSTPGAPLPTTIPTTLPTSTSAAAGPPGAPPLRRRDVAAAMAGRLPAAMTALSVLLVAGER